jgi:hypothetical protein
MDQRPAAVRALQPAQIARNPRFERRIALAQEVLQRDVFGRDRRVGLELEHPVAVQALLREQLGGRSVDGAIEIRLGLAAQQLPRDALGPWHHALPSRRLALQQAIVMAGRPVSAARSAARSTAA